MFKAMREDGLVHHAELTKPALRSDCVDYLDTYRFLSARRLWNEVGPQAISATEISHRLDRLGYTGDDRDKGERFIAMLDDIELRHFYEKRKREQK